MIEKQRRFLKNVYILMILDMLFFPFIPVIKIPWGGILIIVVSIFKGSSIFRVYTPYLLIILSIIISLFFSYLSNEQYFLNNVQTSAILLMSFLYMHCFSKNKERMEPYITNILKVYFLFTFILAVIYFIDNPLYQNIRAVFTMSGKELEYTEFDILNRFVGIMSDPNNCGCSMVAIVAFLIDKIEDNKIKIIYLFMLAYIVTTTMSITAIVAFLIMLILIIKNTRILSGRMLIVIFVIAMLVLMLIFYLPSTTLGELVKNRMELNTSDNTAGGRTKMWADIVLNANIFEHLLWGEGGTILINGNVVPPHNGHLYMLYNYGGIGYISFITWFLKKLANYNWAWIIMLCFTINTLVIDYRATMVFVVLTIAELYSNKKRVES